MIVEYWTGRGVSAAIAAAFASARRRQGRVAVALAPEDLPPDAATVYVVSRSGRPAVDATRLVTLAGRAPHGARTLAVTDPLAAEDPWLPLTWIRSALDAFAVEAGAPPLPPAPASLAAAWEPGTHALFVVDRDADSLAILLAAAGAKVGSLPITACGRGELGHGLHARAGLAPRQHRILRLPEAVAADPGLTRWSALAGLAPWVEPLPPGPAWWLPLVAFRWLADLIETHCSRQALDAGRRPIPDALDTLRAEVTP